MISPEAAVVIGVAFYVIKYAAIGILGGAFSIWISMLIRDC